MTWRSFVWRGLWHYRSSVAGVLAGSALGATILLGSMFAGDSVKATLRQTAAARIGKIDSLLVGGDRFFRAALADSLPHAGQTAAPVLLLKGTATARDSGRSEGNVQVLGVDPRFWSFAPDDGAPIMPGEREMIVNDHLAKNLGLTPGETLVLRFPKPGLTPSDAPLAGEAEQGVTLSGTIRACAGDRQFGRFNLAASQLPQATVFVPLGRLQEASGLTGKANLLLWRGSAPPRTATESATWPYALADYGLSVIDIPAAQASEIRSERIFLDRRLAKTIQELLPGTQPVTTYIQHIIHPSGNPVISFFILHCTITGKIKVFVSREIVGTAPLMITISGSYC